MGLYILHRRPDHRRPTRIHHRDHLAVLIRDILMKGTLHLRRPLHPRITTTMSITITTIGLVVPHLYVAVWLPYAAAVYWRNAASEVTSDESGGYT